MYEKGYGGIYLNLARSYCEDKKKRKKKEQMDGGEMAPRTKIN